MKAAVMGFAPHSGWAAVVVLGGSRADPEILARSRVEMADPRAPLSKQPYHAVEDLGVEEAARRVAGYRKVAESMAYAAVSALAQDLAARGYRAMSVGILESSGRKGSSLAAILASPDVLLLDEPCAGLDTQGVTRRSERAGGEKT